jgi:hypothetical protein
MQRLYQHHKVLQAHTSTVSCSPQHLL